MNNNIYLLLPDPVASVARALIHDRGESPIALQENFLLPEDNMDNEEVIKTTAFSTYELDNEKQKSLTGTWCCFFIH